MTRDSLPLRFVVFSVVGLAWASLGPALQAEERTLETPFGTLRSFVPEPSKVGPEGGPPSFTGDTYSFAHKLSGTGTGCLDPHLTGMSDNTVTFDGVTETLDPYTNGTQPSIFEFESVALLGGEMDAFFNSFADDDLFPEGFEDPETGSPLTDACVEIGIDDSLDANVLAEVLSAIIEGSNSDGSPIPSTDITSLFSNPWDGRTSIVFPGAAGQDIDGMTLNMTVQQGVFDPQPIFADGFESGDAAAWTTN